MLLKEHNFKFIFSGNLIANPGEVVEQRQVLSRMRVSILRGLTSFHVAMGRDVGVLGLHLGFSSNGCFIQLNVFC